MVPRRVVIVLQARDAARAQARERGRDARARPARGAASSARSRRPRWCWSRRRSTSAARMFKLLQKQATIVECGALEDLADAERWVRTRVARGRRGDRAGRGAASDRPARRRSDVTSAVCAATSIGCCSTRWGRSRSPSTTCGEVVGPAALQDDWAMTNAIEAGQAAEALRQLALMFDAGAPAEKILGQLGWLVRTKFPAARAGRRAPGDRGAVPDRPGSQAVGRRPARPARTPDRRIVCREAGGGPAVVTLG